MPKRRNDPPDLSTHYGRLRWAREEAGYSSDRAAAKALGWPVDGYKKHEEGTRQKDGFHVDTAKKYARGFGVSVTWLMTGRGSAVLTPEDAEWSEMSADERKLAIRLVKAAS